MEICKRRSSYDSNKSLYSTNAVPSTAAGNLTVTFSSQLNQHNQVWPVPSPQILTRVEGPVTRLALISGGFNSSNRCLQPGERCLCWTTSQLCTSRRPSTFPGWLNRVSRSQRVLLGCVARQNPSSRLSSSAHPPLFKVKDKVSAFRLKKGGKQQGVCVSVEGLWNAKKPPWWFTPIWLTRRVSWVYPPPLIGVGLSPPTRWLLLITTSP